MTAILVALLGVLGVSTTSAVTYFVARRNTSGRIETTEASKLWDEAENIRQALRDDVVALRNEAEVLRAELWERKKDMLALRREMATLRRHATTAAAHARRCEQELAMLKGAS